MLWGYQNGWFPEFFPDQKPTLWGKLAFLQQHGLHETCIDFEQLLALPADELQRLAAHLSTHDLHLSLAVWYDYVNADDPAADTAQRRIVQGLETLIPLMRTTAVFTRAGCGHRFDDTLPVADKLSRLSARLKPLAAACKRLNVRLGINNQGDFYIDDFVHLCTTTPDLYLWIDTSNIFWAGEPIFPAFERAAPHTIGTHWRDEKITLGSRQPRGVLLHNCTTGQGHVPLPRCYQTLLDHAPDPDHLVMEIELFPAGGTDRLKAVDEALAFCRTLTGGAL